MNEVSWRRRDHIDTIYKFIDTKVIMIVRKERRENQWALPYEGVKVGCWKSIEDIVVENVHETFVGFCEEVRGMCGMCGFFTSA